jgi:hypothetical protein
MPHSLGGICLCCRFLDPLKPTPHQILPAQCAGFFIVRHEYRLRRYEKSYRFMFGWGKGYQVEISFTESGYQDSK